jgi:hypothetical protein
MDPKAQLKATLIELLESIAAHDFADAGDALVHLEEFADSGVAMPQVELRAAMNTLRRHGTATALAAADSTVSNSTGIEV